MVVDGDKIICLCAKMLKDEGELIGDRVTATVMSNIGFHKYCEKNGISVDVTKVGDRYVLESMLETGCILGGEQSGHIIFLNRTTTGDGVLSSLQFLKILLDSKEPLSKLAKEVELFPQVLENAKVANMNKELFLKDSEILTEIAKIEKEVSEDGRLLIRPSGTEPVVRVMIEGKDIAKIHKMALGLADLITKKYGA